MLPVWSFFGCGRVRKATRPHSRRALPWGDNGLTSVTIRALIFDFDGLILDTEEPVYRSWREVYKAHGVELPFDLWVQIVGSTTATFIFQSRFLDSATAVSMAARARSSDIAGPYGVSNGILSGTKSRGFASVICCAALLTDIYPPSIVAVEIARSSMDRNSLRLTCSRRCVGSLREGGEIALAAIIR